MKTILFKTIAIVLLVAGAMACKKEKGDTFPQEVPFTEYSLTDTYCQWQNLNYDKKLIIIDSLAALDEYVSCTEGTFPEIDFSKNTLLIVSGIGAGNVISIHTTFIQYAAAQYELSVIVRTRMLIITESWRISILAPKIPNGAAINVTVESVLSNN
ncbi:MAG: hypothetical protein LBF90_01940 [Prevotellaceae bacterium]|jgi:hypothetical protein|nr:hypothetical protein [Prevotellaceae bacterium]